MVSGKLRKETIQLLQQNLGQPKSEVPATDGLHQPLNPTLCLPFLRNKRSDLLQALPLGELLRFILTEKVSSLHRNALELESRNDQTLLLLAQFQYTPMYVMIICQS